MLLCPRSSWTVLRSTPLITRREAEVCLRSWNRNFLIFALLKDAHSFLQGRYYNIMRISQDIFLPSFSQIAFRQRCSPESITATTTVKEGSSLFSLQCRHPVPRYCALHGTEHCIASLRTLIKKAPPL